MLGRCGVEKMCKSWRALSMIMSDILFSIRSIPRCSSISLNLDHNLTSCSADTHKEFSLDVEFYVTNAQLDAKKNSILKNIKFHLCSK
jgi:hypothetical protein